MSNLDNNDEERVIDPPSDTREEEEEEANSSRYRRFVKTGFGRVIITRLLSLVYIIYVSRFFPLIVQDKMILLATGQYISIQISMLGLRYAIIQNSIVQKRSLEQVYQVIFTALFLGLPIIITGSLVTVILTDVTVGQTLLFTLSSILYFFMEISIIINDTKLDADKSIITNALYSIFNSITVPIIYYFNNSLNGVLIAWIISFAVTLLYASKVLIPIFYNMTFNFPLVFDLIKYGFPIYVSTIYMLVIGRVDNFILYTFFAEGQTSQYYWVMRLATISQELFIVTLSGLGPLMMNIYKNGEIELFTSRVISILRISFVLATIYYCFVLLGSKSIILLILSSRFISGLTLLKLAVFGYYFDMIVKVIGMALGAQGKRKSLLKGRVLSSTLRLVLILFLYRIGSIGLIIAFFTTKILSSLIFFREQFGLRALISRSSFRILVFGILIMLSSFILNANFQVLSIVLYSALQFMIIVVLFLITKPLKTQDFQLIERIIKIDWIINSGIYQFFKNQSINYQ